MDIVEWFRAAFATSPAWVYTAPGGINLLGHYAPFTGYAMPITLSQQVVCAVGYRDDRRVVVRSMQEPTDVVDLDLDTIQPADDVYGPFSSRIAAAAFGQGTHHLRGINAVVGSDDVRIIGDLSMLPATPLNALMALVLRQAAHPFEDRVRLAHDIQNGEHDLLYWKTGLVEHLATMCGQEDAVLLYDWDSDTVESVPLNLRAAGLTLLVANLFETRGGFIGRDPGRERTWGFVRPFLDMTAQLDDRYWSQLPKLLMDIGFPDDEDAIGLVRHVMEENARVRDVTTRLKAGENPRLLGPALTASHASLRANYRMQMSDGAQATVQAAMSAGALGARVTGGPFSDWVVALVETSAAAGFSSTVRTAVNQLGFGLTFFPVVPTAAAGIRPDPPDPIPPPGSSEPLPLP